MTHEPSGYEQPPGRGELPGRADVPAHGDAAGRTGEGGPGHGPTPGRTGAAGEAADRHGGTAGRTGEGSGRTEESAGPGAASGRTGDASGRGPGHGATRADLGSGPGTGSGTDDGGRPGKLRLTRGRPDERVIAGVCQGAGRYFGVDPVIFRVVLAVLSLTGGIGLIVYGMGWLVVPQEGERDSEAHRLLSGRIEGAPLTAGLMTLVGCGLYASMLGNGANQAFSLVLLTGTAGAVYWSQARRRLETAGDLPAPGAGPGGATRVASAVPDAPPAVQAPPEPGGAPSWWREPLGKPPAYLWGPADGPVSGSARSGVFGGAWNGTFTGLQHGPRSRQDAAAWKARRRAERRAHSAWFGFVTFLLAAGAAALGAGVTWPYQPAPVAAEIGLAAALGVFGTAFVIASFAGRARGGTVLLSLITIAGLIGVAMLPKAGQGVRTTIWRPATAAAVQPSYERGAGRGVLDLTGLPLNGTTVVTRVRVGAGEAEVLLPPGATARIDYDLRIGDVTVEGQPHGEHAEVNSGRHGTVLLPPPVGMTSGGTIDVHVSVGVGQLKVVR